MQVVVSTTFILGISRYGVDYWSKKFGVSEQQLKDAVKKAGVMVKDVQKQLGN